MHEIKKWEAEMTKLKEKLTKISQETKLDNIKNTMELKSYTIWGNTQYGKDPDAEFLQLVSKTSQDWIRMLENENSEIWECLKML